MPNFTLGFVRWLAPAIVGLACTGLTIEDPYDESFLVGGIVRSPDGTGMPGVDVRGQMYETDCSDAATPLVIGYDTTDAAGRYEVEVYEPRGRATGCLQVVARPLSGDLPVKTYEDPTIDSVVVTPRAFRLEIDFVY